MRYCIPLFCLLLLLVSCGDEKEEDMYPNILTDFACLPTDERGMMHQLVLDNGTCYPIANPQQQTQPNATYRAVCGYALTEREQAMLYSLTPVFVLRDSTSTVVHDPTGITSAWHSGEYINMILTPRTYGGEQFWGFAQDSTIATHHYLSLHHRQGDDAMAYSTTVYASLPIKNIPGIAHGDDITLWVHTPNGLRRWDFTY